MNRRSRSPDAASMTCHVETVALLCGRSGSPFMAPFEMQQVKKHALAAINPEHYGHLSRQSERCEDFLTVTFLESRCRPEREPDLGYETNWTHEAQNQTALLDGFAAHLREDYFLCLFYAKKHVPFVEGTERYSSPLEESKRSANRRNISEKARACAACYGSARCSTQLTQRQGRLSNPYTTSCCSVPNKTLRSTWIAMLLRRQMSTGMSFPTGSERRR